MSSHTTTGSIGLSLEPLDTLFFRDGRPFEAGFRATSGMPQPQTLAGALRTWLLRRVGCDFEKLAEAMKEGRSFQQVAAEAQPPEVGQIAQLRFRGPWFALEGRPLVPAPATLRRVKSEQKEENVIVRMEPLSDHDSLPGWSPAESGMRPVWLRDTRPTERVDSGYLTLSGLKTFLEGETPCSKQDIVRAEKLFGLDHRTGIAVNPEKLSAEESMIYGIGLLALKKEVSLYAEVTGPEEALRLLPDEPTTLPLGGEGRRVILKRQQPVQWPQVAASDGNKPLLLLTSPGLFNGWRPERLKGNLLGAVVPGYVAVSGWDLARKGPKPARFAVAAGSVYFLKEDLDLSDGSLCEGEDATLGWGTFLKGVWDYV